MPLRETKTARSRQPRMHSNASAASVRAPGSTSTPRTALAGAARIAQMQRLVGNRAVLQMLRAEASSQSSQAGGVIQRQPSYRLPKEDKSDEFDEYEKTSFSSDDLEGKEGSDGKFTAVQADKGMPTYYGALKRIFGEDNLNIKKFDGTSKVLGDAADRPHSVTANIDIQTTNKGTRENGPLATAIGHFGYEQLDIQEGDGVDRAMDYNGGHLVGYQVLGGVEADQEWNIAPQDADNNKFAYNNTIEEMARKATKKTNFDYTVELKYKSPNFAVDQNQLLEHGYIKQTDDSKPWTIQLPTRIPQHWSAKAVINSDEGSFGSPTLNDPESPKKTYDQLSQELDSDLSHNDTTHTARFKLTYENANNESISESDVANRLSDIRSVHYRMHQEQPKNIDKLQMPDDWKGGEKSDFGSVEKEQITAELVLKLREDLEQDYRELDEMSDVSEHEFDFSDFYQKKVQEVSDTSDTGRMLLFGVLMDEKSDEIRKLGSLHDDCERTRQLVLNQKEKLKTTKVYRAKVKGKEIDSKTPGDELSQEAEEIQTHRSNLKRAGACLDAYNKKVKKRKIAIDKVKNIVISSHTEATSSNYEDKIKSDKIRKKIPSVFSGIRGSNYKAKEMNYFSGISIDLFPGFPIIPEQQPPDIKDFMKMEDDESE